MMKILEKKIQDYLYTVLLEEERKSGRKDLTIKNLKINMASISKAKLKTKIT